MNGEQYNLNYDTKVRKSSPVKAAIAQQKPRDNKGRFLSGAALTQYRANQERQQQMMEREKVAAMLNQSKSSYPMTVNNGQSNFQTILNRNKPADDKWAMLLGKKK